ncbi:hypothetical protein N7493_006522 [Penicillium malachiteum]|uniref:Uncharacterized protein n=1 Tax=Penicillium malachiteum TaxID=1324776 RepID=A0AAD6HL68_9EURO|nr:hypothetical protein N7493_006522 [Penicillium malachiteum]
MITENEESRVQRSVTFEDKQHFLTLLLFSIYVNCEALELRLKKIRTAKNELYINRHAGNISAAKFLEQEIVRYYDEADEYHSLIDAGLKRAYCLLQELKTMRELADVADV